jgi:hypothetical protein
MDNNSWISGDLIDSDLYDFAIGKINHRFVKVELELLKSNKTIRMKFLTRNDLSLIKEKIEDYEKRNGEIKGEILSAKAKKRVFNGK